MASIHTLLFISFVLLFGCLYEEVGAVQRKGRSRRQTPLRELRFTQIISGVSTCRLQDTFGKRLYANRFNLNCDLSVLVIDRDDQEEYEMPWSRGRGMADQPGYPTRGYDNSTLATAVDQTIQNFCVHRAVVAARSDYLKVKIDTALSGEGRSSYYYRNMRIRIEDDIPPTIFGFILEYIYTYQISNLDTENHIIDLYVAAYIMELHVLRKSILEYILDDIPNSIEQVHKIRKWIRWAQERRRYDLEWDLINAIKKVLKLDSTEKGWQSFGTFMCSITQAEYEMNLRKQASDFERTRVSDRNRDRIGDRIGDRVPPRRMDGLPDRERDRDQPIIKK